MVQEPRPGRNRELTRDAVEGALSESDIPVLTAAMIGEHVGVTRQTVHRVLEKEGMAEEWGLRSNKVGNATVYWLPPTSATADGGWVNSILRTVRLEEAATFAMLLSAIAAFKIMNTLLGLNIDLTDDMGLALAILFFAWAVVKLATVVWGRTERKEARLLRGEP